MTRSRRDAWLEGMRIERRDRCGPLGRQANNGQRMQIRYVARFHIVILAKAGAQCGEGIAVRLWVRAFAGMTGTALIRCQLTPH